jgi:hypothetical protein
LSGKTEESHENLRQYSQAISEQSTSRIQFLERYSYNSQWVFVFWILKKRCYQFSAYKCASP